MTANKYTAADAMLEALQDMGVYYLFSSLGSDHMAIIEGLAKAREKGDQLPEVIICPHEFVALSAAHGHALVSSKTQGVIVHCDVGTQNLGSAVHNAFRARVPVFIFSGETPYTTDGETFGSRNSPINYLQDINDQRAIVRPYVKWEYGIRTGKNVKQLVYRAIQLANSDIKGPVYLTSPREVLDEEITPTPCSNDGWTPVRPIPLSSQAVMEIVDSLHGAEKPVILTSYLGRNGQAVTELVKFCETLGIGVIEQLVTCMNFPGDHPMHLGFLEDEFIADADVILVLDSDVPWINKLQKPAQNSKIYYIDIDPLKEKIPLWFKPSEAFFKADTSEVLKQFNDYLAELNIDAEKVRERFRRYSEIHDHQRQEWVKKEQLPNDHVITAEWLTACIREVIDNDTIILNEAITNLDIVSQHLPRKKPGTLFGPGGTGLGWSGGAAIGAKLANPDKTVVNLIGDGSYQFSVPSSVYWVSRRYSAPILTIIYNNEGWGAVKRNQIRHHPDGISRKTDRYWANFDQPADLSKIAEAAGGAYARKVEKPDELLDALANGIKHVKNGRSAVVDVCLAKISGQKD